jgi:hypothetical protein
MQLPIEHARGKFAKVKNRWAACYGPGAAYLQTCRRLGWQVIDAAKVRTDQGELLDLRLDPTAVVVQQCHLAVQRWRWKRVEKSFPQ